MKSLEENALKGALVNVDVESSTSRHSFLRDDRFGPQQYFQYTMALPKFYPKKAGMAKQAFSYQLNEFNKQKEAIYKAALPTAIHLLDKMLESTDYLQAPAGNKKEIDEEGEVDDVDDIAEGAIISVKSNKSLSKSRKKKKKLAAEKPVLMYYPGTRRPAAIQAPGMTNHYPNPNYTEPTTALPYDKNANKTNLSSLVSFFSFGKKQGSNLIPQVGRKLREIDLLKAKEKEEEELLKSKLSASTDNENSQMAHHHHHHHHHRKTTMKIELIGGTDIGVKNSSDVKPPSTDNSVDKSIALENSVGKSVKMTTPSMSTKALSKSQKAAIDERNYKQALENYIASRRGSFPVAPGLESFDTAKTIDQDDEADKDDALVPAKAVAVHGKGKLSELTSEERSYLRHKVGLLRSCVINGFEIVHQGAINDATFSPSEKRLVSAGGDGIIKMWDPRDGTYIRQFEAFNYQRMLLGGNTNGVPRKPSGGEILAVAYTNDELYLVSAGSDAVILIWDLTTCLVTRYLKGHSDIINCMSITHDCNQIVTGSFDGIIKTWFLTPRHPDPPDPPRVISRTDTSML